jgi:hypothetical protein
VRRSKVVDLLKSVSIAIPDTSKPDGFSNQSPLMRRLILIGAHGGQVGVKGCTPWAVFVVIGLRNREDAKASSLPRRTCEVLLRPRGPVGPFGFPLWGAGDFPKGSRWLEKNPKDSWRREGVTLLKPRGSISIKIENEKISAEPKIPSVK